MQELKIKREKKGFREKGLGEEKGKQWGNPRETLPTREIEKGGKQRNEKGKCECKEDKQAQAVILPQKVKRKSHRRRKIIPFGG